MDLIQSIRPADRKDALRRAQIGAFLTSLGAICTASFLIYRKSAPKLHEFYKKLQESGSLHPHESSLQGKAKLIVLGAYGMVGLFVAGLSLDMTFKSCKHLGSESGGGNTVRFALAGVSWGILALWHSLAPFHMCSSDVVDVWQEDWRSLAVLKEVFEATMLLYPLPGRGYWLFVGASFVTMGV